MNTRQTLLSSLLFSAVLVAEEQPSMGRNPESNWHNSRSPQGQTTHPHKTAYRWPINGSLSLGFENFRSIPDGSWTGNTGGFLSANFAIPISPINYGFSLQIGGSYGIYDWYGRSSPLGINSSSIEQEAFTTVGFYRVTPHRWGFNIGAVYDVLLNTNFGTFGVDPNLSQVRAQLGFTFLKNELGLWGTVNVGESHKEFLGIPLTFRAISQANVFWRCHMFKNQAETVFWAGLPYRNGLLFSSGKSGTFIVGFSFKTPLTNCLSIEGNAVYMGARGTKFFPHSHNDASDVCIRLTYSFGDHPRRPTTYLPLANNSNFLVDANLNN